MTNNLNNFSYNIIVANLHEMYSFYLMKLKIITQKLHYWKVIKKFITIMPVIPHFSTMLILIKSKRRIQMASI